MKYKLIKISEKYYILTGKVLTREQANVTPHYQTFDGVFLEIIAGYEGLPTLNLSKISDEDRIKLISSKSNIMNVEIELDSIPADRAPGGWDVFPKIEFNSIKILKIEL